MKKHLLRLTFLTLPIFGFSQYCGPLNFTSQVEPITLVNFAGMNNQTSAAIGGTPAHEFFLDKTANVIKGYSYDITLKGNTNDLVAWDLYYTSQFMVFIDWNKDNDFDDDGEAYHVGSITGSTGLDDKKIIYEITVPADATTGITRMRVKKIYGSADLNDPCKGTSYGQAEDYTVNIIAETLCTGVPTVGEATSSATNACVGVAFTLDSNTTQVAGYKYQWQSSTDHGDNWINLGSPQDIVTYIVSSQTVTTSYRVIVTCSDSGESAASSMVTVNQSPFSQCYCTNAIIFNCTDGDVIQNVTFAGINKNSQCGNSTTGYSDYTSETAAEVTVDKTYPISVKVGPSGDGWLHESVGVWIDFNQNGVFDSNEYTYVGTGLNQVLTKDIAIPADAKLGSTRMRVVVAAATAEVFGDDRKCGPINSDENFGEMEDYTVNIGTLAVADVSRLSVKSYPNPVKDIFNIEAQGKIKTVKVFDASGKQIFIQELNDAKSQIDFSRFTPGVYIVTTTLQDGISTSAKVIKK